MFRTISVMIAIAIIPATAIANDITSITVPYRDLDLSSAEGQTVLTKRIARAAKSVCPADDARNLGAVRSTQKCRSQAIARTASQIAIATQRQTREVQARYSGQPIS